MPARACSAPSAMRITAAAVTSCGRAGLDAGNPIGGLPRHVRARRRRRERRIHQSEDSDPYGRLEGRT